MPYTQSYTVGWQRKLTSNTAFEVRYVGSRHRQDWETVNINEVNITSQRLRQEFRKAQANLQANIAAGRGATFAYTGAAGHLAAADLPGVLPGAAERRRRANAASYTSAQFTNATNLGFLAAHEPEPVRLRVGELDQRLRRQLDVPHQRHRRGSAGELLPRQPRRARRHRQQLGGANLTTNFGGTRANSIQLEFRKRLSNGLTFSTSYAWASAYMMQRYGFSKPLEEIAQTGQVGNVQHAIKGNWLYELPFGERQAVGRPLERLRQRAARRLGVRRRRPHPDRRACSTSATCAWSA